MQQLQESSKRSLYYIPIYLAYFVILQIILNVLVCNILFMNLNRSYEGNKSGTIFVAKKLELKG